MTDNDCKNPEKSNRRQCVAMEKGLINEKFDNLFNLMKSIDEKIDNVGRKVDKMDEINHAQDLKIEKIRGEIETIKDRQRESKGELEKQVHILHESRRRGEKKTMWVLSTMIAVVAVVATIINMFLK